jgi:hypothetical protein
MTEKDFRLAAFGLPEPNAYSGDTSRRIFIMLVISIILIAIALWIQFSKHKTDS